MNPDSPQHGAGTPPAVHPDDLSLAETYQGTLLNNVIPFWLRHGIDPVHGGIMTSLNRDGSVVDTDKSVWFQGRAAWMFATLYNTIERRPEWLHAATSCHDFLRNHCVSESGKMYFLVTRDGKPLRMRRYVYSESFGAIASAAVARATASSDGEPEPGATVEALERFSTYLRYSFTPGVMQPKLEPTRPQQGIGSHMIGIVTAQEIRANLGDRMVDGRTCTGWIDYSIEQIEKYFLKPDLRALMETVGPNGEILDHFDGRLLNPGHAIECAWFIMHEGRLRNSARLIQLGLTILDWMWERGWDRQHGGILYFCDLKNLPIQEYWHHMKFWWPHNETIIATLLAFKLTGDARYAEWHRKVHDWSFRHFSDSEHGEWYGYLQQDGTVTSTLKGNHWKGPFHLPRMLWYCCKLLSE